MLGNAPLGTAPLGTAGDAGSSIVYGAGVAAGAGQASGGGGLAPADKGAGSAAGVGGAAAVGGPIVAGVGASSGQAGGDAPNYTAAVGLARGKATVHGSGPIPPSRFLAGRLPNGARGIRISQPGYNASSDPVDNERLIFSSEWPEAIPIYLQGNARVFASKGGTLVTTVNFPSLGFVPYTEFIFRSAADAVGGNTWGDVTRFYPRNALAVPYWVPLGPDGNNFCRANVSDGQLRFEFAVRNSTTTFGFPVSWFVYWTIFRKRVN